MATKNFYNLNWAFIHACFCRSGMNKKQFYEQRFARLCPRIKLPSLSTFYAYIRAQESLPKPETSVNIPASTVTSSDSIGTQIDLVPTHKAELSIELSCFRYVPETRLAVLLTSVLNVPPWLVTQASEQEPSTSQPLDLEHFMLFNDLSKRKIFLVTIPVDMRKGFNKLSSFALTNLGLDVFNGKSYIVFINRHAKALKIICRCGNQNLLLNVALDKGCFQRVVQRAHEPAYIKLTKSEFLSYIRGFDIMTKRVYP